MPRKTKAQAFREDLAHVDETVAAFMAKEKIKTWDDVRQWLESRAESLLAGTASVRTMYFEILRVGQAHGVPTIDPLGFAHPSIPLEEQARLARRYRTPAQLAESAFNRNTPRGDVMAAYILGVLSKEELERIPVKFNKEARYTLRRKRRQ